ncbi:HBR470Wp [Eremothecium sinecaudum]|uniref:HBR470Wp n=1 Tax=Eremothecium sinecaudum TaxID=45286 RepID=A0A109UVL9_9SACH|nr:HBR470Wp [Eremothecium sinecaudum]AMD19371.1 HBR470Wp [Eremothecium sinecaudum]
MAGIVRKGHGKRVRAKRSIGSNSASGSLFGRIGTATKGNKNNEPRKKELEGASNALRFINGRFVSANDVGVQLREFNNNIVGNGNSSNKKSLKKDAMMRRKLIAQQHASIPIVPPRTVFSSSNYDDKEDISKTKKRKAKNLVISLRNGSEFLGLRNLPVGVKKETLKKALEEHGTCRVSNIKVLDLPTGSATAEVHIVSESSGNELQRLVKQFHGAEIDGRVISADIRSTSEL